MQNSIPRFRQSSIISERPCYSLRKNCPYLELFWSAFSRIGTDYREILSVLIQSECGKNAEQNNSEYGHFYTVICLWIENFDELQLP